MIEPILDFCVTVIPNANTDIPIECLRLNQYMLGGHYQAVCDLRIFVFKDLLAQSDFKYSVKIYIDSLQNGDNLFAVNCKIDKHMFHKILPMVIDDEIKAIGKKIKEEK